MINSGNRPEAGNQKSDEPHQRIMDVHQVHGGSGEDGTDAFPDTSPEPQKTFTGADSDTLIENSVYGFVVYEMVAWLAGNEEDFVPSSYQAPVKFIGHLPSTADLVGKTVILKGEDA